MKTTLGADGQIGIPQLIRDVDRLKPGDSFDLERLTPGHYLLAKNQAPDVRFTVAQGDDGLPIIRIATGTITSRLVREIESQSP